MSLKAEAVKGVKWTSLSFITDVVTNFLVLAVMARLLNPEDFGLIAMVLIVIGFGDVFVDAGISNALIHFQKITVKELSSLYWFSIFLGVACSLTVFFSAGSVNRFLGAQDIESLLQVSSIYFILVAVGLQYRVLMQKELMFKQFTVYEICGLIVGRIVAVCCGFLGFGALSLIIGHLVTVALRSFFYVYKGRRIFSLKLYFNLKCLGKYLVFGLYQLGARILNFIGARVDQLLIGKYLGSSRLGYYTQATELTRYSYIKINPIISSVLFPVFAKIQDNTDAMNRAYLKMLRLLCYLSFPLLVGLITLTTPFVEVMYSSKWLPIVPVMRVFALVCIFNAFLNPFAVTVLLAQGRVKIGFYWELGMTVLKIVLTVWGVTHSLLFLSWTYFGMAACTFVISYFIYFRYMLHTRLWDFLVTFFKPLSVSMLMGLAILCVNMFAWQHSLIHLCTGIFAGVLSYIFLLYLFERELVLKLIAVARRKAAFSEIL